MAGLVAAGGAARRLRAHGLGQRRRRRRRHHLRLPRALVRHPGARRDRLHPRSSMLVNLRGIRESGTVFAIPTYVFLVSMLALIAIGVGRTLLGDAPQVTGVTPVVVPTETLGILLLMRAFADGCSAITGVEAVSNGVPAFRRPEAAHARTTLAVMGALVGVMFLGCSYLAGVVGAVPSANETVISQIGRAVFGTGVAYYVLQFSTMGILDPRRQHVLRRLPAARRRCSPATGSCRAASRSAANASRSTRASSRSPSCRSSCWRHSADASRRSSRCTRSACSPRSRCRRPGWSSTGGATGARAGGEASRSTASARSRPVSSRSSSRSPSSPSGRGSSSIIIPILVGGMLLIGPPYRRRRIETEVREETVIGPPRRHQRVMVPAADVTRDVVQAIRFARTMSDDVTAVHVTDDRRGRRADPGAVRAAAARRAAGHRRVAVPVARPAAGSLPRRRRRGSIARRRRRRAPPRVRATPLVGAVPLQRERPADPAGRCWATPNILVAEVPYRASA